MAGSSRSRAEPRRRRSAEDLSAAIVAAGLRALEERGWESLTIADVAQRAGISAGSV
jgi:AcrR family transcriptional regulator